MITASTLHFERLEIRAHERQLIVDGHEAAIGARAFDVLLALAERRGQLVSKSELLDLVWPDLVVEEGNLHVHISHLRKALGPDVIATIPGRGYRFTARLAESPNARPDEQPHERPDEQTHERSHQRATGQEYQTQAALLPGAGQSSASHVAMPARLRTNLPDVLPQLIGRDDDLVALGALLERQRLVSIVGPGGIGKTSVAQALLAERCGSYPHGVCFVELATTSQPDALPGVIGAALGVNLGSGDAMRGLIGAVAPLSVLIALDNAEHLIEAVAVTAEALLAGAPNVRLLVTSQVPLKISSERVFRIGALAVPEDTPSLAEALRFGAVALFAERAQAVDRRFVLSETNLASVLELCRRLDGLALAIELAAARAPLLGLPALIASLDQRLRVLTGGSRIAPARQQTLRAALEWSHGLLDGAEQKIFRRLAVFVGSASLEAAQRVLADADVGGMDEWAVLDTLGTLVDRSLVEVIVDHNDERAAPRYRLLDTTLAYAHERMIAAGEEEALRRRHASVMRQIFERAYQEYWSGRIGSDAWRESLRPDLDNGRAAVTVALAHEPAAALAIAATLGRGMSGNMYRERVTLWEAVEPLIDGAPSSAPLVPVLAARAAYECAGHWMLTRPKRGLALAQQALELFRAHGENEGAYKALARIAILSARLGDLDAAQGAIEDMCGLEDPAWPPIVRVLGAEAQAHLCLDRGDDNGALRYLRKELDLEQAAGFNNSLALNNLAYVALKAGHSEEAIASSRTLVEQFAATRQQLGSAFAHLNLTAALLAQGETTEARALARACWPQARLFELQPYWADYLALLAALEGRPRTALRLAGYADAANAARDSVREINEQRAIDRAQQLARAALAARGDAANDDAGCDRLEAEGAALRDEDIAGFAFAEADAP